MVARLVTTAHELVTVRQQTAAMADIVRST